MRRDLLNLDRNTYRWLNQFHRNHNTIQAARLVSHTGDGHLYGLIGLLVCLLPIENKWLFVQSGLLAFAIELPAFIILKICIKRDRPFVQVPDSQFFIQPSDKFSMPSGHTSAAFLAATLICYFYPSLAVVALIWAGFIGGSRVVLGVHYPGDILAGLVLGTVAALTAIVVIN